MASITMYLYSNTDMAAILLLNENVQIKFFRKKETCHLYIGFEVMIIISIY